MELILNMREAKYSALLLFVTTLLIASCRGAEHAAEQGTGNHDVCVESNPGVCCRISTIPCVSFVVFFFF